MPSISDIRRLAGLTTLLLITQVGAEAVPSGNMPSENEIVLRADRATLSQQEGTGLYEGNAELIQGQRSLKADRIEITLKNGKPSKVEATGNPVELLDGGELSARAGKLVYDIEGRRILPLRARVGRLRIGECGIPNRGVRHLGLSRIPARDEGQPRAENEEGTSVPVCR